MWFVRSFLILAGVVAFLWLGMENADQTVDFTFFTKVYPGLELTFLMMIVFVAGFRRFSTFVPVPGFVVA